MDITYYKQYEPIFGSWYITRELGEGSFGKVFEIEREDFGYTYKAALKVITIPQNRSEIDSIRADGMSEDSITDYYKGFVGELVDEIRLMSKLKGESHIVSYEDHLVIPHEQGVGWDILIRMQYLTPLLSYTKEHSLSAEETAELGIEMCKALELCRKFNIIHRDIKPENIFVSETGHFKLGDFGIAKTVEKTVGGLSKKGTYAYMAPEVYKEEKYGASVDIYSLGIVLFRFLNNNRAPFMPPYPEPITFKSRENAIYRRMSGEPIPFPSCPDKTLSEIVLRACAFDAKDRYSDASEMREVLEAWKSERKHNSSNMELESGSRSNDSFLEGDNLDDKTVGVFSLHEHREKRCVEEKTQISDDHNSTSSTIPAISSVDTGEATSDFEIINGEVYSQFRKEAKRSESKTSSNRIVEVYDGSGCLFMRVYYNITLGNRYKVEWHNRRGYIEIAELYDYQDRLRTRNIYSSNRTLLQCTQYDYKNGRRIEKQI